MKKLFYIIFLTAAANLFIYPQSSSSYSRYGAGDIEYTYSARRLGMGSLGVSAADPDFISVINPAGIHRLNKTRFEADVKYSGLFLNNGKQNYFGSDFEFQGLTLAFPVSMDNGIAFALGVLPYSNVSYKVAQDVTGISDVSQDYKIIYEGRGGMSKLFVGSSWTLPYDVTIGADFEYYFGNLNYFSRTDFLNSSVLDAEYERRYSSRGMGATFGVISSDIAEFFHSSVISDFRLGLSYNYIGEFNTDTLLTSTTSIDTTRIGEGETTMQLPSSIAAGLSFVLNKNYLVTLDVMMHNWSNFKIQSRPNSALNLRNALKLSGGIEYRPGREGAASFWQQILLRGGISYEQTQYRINGTGINQFAVSGGFSLPLSPENYIDIGLQYAFRGTTDNGLFKENSLRLGIGLNIGESWFIRQEK